MQFIKNLIKRLFRLSNAGRKFIQVKQLVPYLTKIGWLRSVNERASIDANGEPLPWYTYSFIRFLEARVRPDMTVFEFGSGNSTRWWSSRVKQVVSCEHESEWFDRMRKLVPQSVDYRHVPLEYGGEYCRDASSSGMTYDVIVIDGRDRVNCARNSVNALSSSGVIIWDNANRKKYTEGYDYLAKKGFRRLDFWGLCPIECFDSCTSLFYRDGNCFGV